MLKFALIILTVVLSIYFYIDALNEVMQIRLAIPLIQKENQLLAEENLRLQYEIDQFESPLHLMEIARKPEYGHLKMPYLKDVILIHEEHTQTTSKIGFGQSESSLKWPIKNGSIL